ncbi:MAG TPA: hypothetical protein VKM72_36390 [Thermoanaerobaculia bacterium]|nr:hypothetical protein [Thermoanaerobaculia bacterium]
MLSRKLRLLASCALALVLFACFEPPVLETLDLRFLRDGSFVVTSTVEVSDEKGEANPALTRRLAQVRQELEEGTDPWGRRFASLEPVAERFAWEKQLGALRRGTRAAIATEPAGLHAFFGDTSLNVSYEIRDGVAELAIAPGSPARASRSQRDEVERTLDAWSGHVAAYLKEAGDLWTYLDERPDRAHSCLGTLFEDLLADEVREKLEPLTEDELERIDLLRQAMEQVMAVLLVSEGADHSPDELSHLVYDPFPARLTVRLPGRPLEAPEGFAIDPDGKTLVATGPGLWQALQSLEGRWLAPDPALLYVQRDGRDQKEPLDLDTLVALARRSEPAPYADEVREALEDRLHPEPLYRVTFAVQPDAEPTAAEIGWSF